MDDAVAADEIQSSSSSVYTESKLQPNTPLNKSSTLETPPSIARFPSQCDQDINSTTANMISMTDSVPRWKKYLKQALPLLLLITVNLLLTYTTLIVLFIGFILVLHWSNNIIVRQAQLQNQRSLAALCLLFGFHFINIILTIPLVQNFWFFNCFHVVSWWNSPPSFWNVLFNVSIMDFLLKFFTICLKCCVIVPTTRLVPAERRGGMFIIIEGISQSFRCIMPAPEWIKYIVMASSCVSSVVCWLVAGLYIAVKIIGSPTPKDDEENPTKGKGVCPICHGRFYDPMVLPCGHLFCHDCCQLWFDREQHCPVCSSDSVFALVAGSIQTLPSPIKLTGKNSCWKTGSSDFIVQLF